MTAIITLRCLLVCAAHYRDVVVAWRFTRYEWERRVSYVGVTLPYRRARIPSACA